MTESESQQNQGAQDSGDQNPKVVRMPEREIMLRKLHEGGAMGISDQTNSFYYKLVEDLSDKEIVGIGLNMAWELAQADTLGGQDPMVRAVVNMSFDQVINAITPDPEVAEQAKAFRKKIMDQLRREREAEKQAPVEDPASNYELYTSARKIADIVHEVAQSVSTNRDYISLDDRRDEGVNPYYNQSQSGLFLNFSYGIPTSIWTPWGEWNFRGSAGSGGAGESKLFEGIMARLEISELRPEIYNEQGSFGPTYAVHKVDGIELPDPVIRPRNAYLGYDEANKVWERFTKKYLASQGKQIPISTTEKFKLDDTILKARGEAEPSINDNDIKTLWQLAFYKGQVVKYTRDGGQTWHYTKLWNSEAVYFKGGNLGFSADEEVMPNIQVHSSRALTDKDFENGMVVRPAKSEEIENIKFSYENLG